MTKYEPVIGLEIHIQAKTKSKMFCSCAADYFGAEPNTHVCPVCLGLPGALPVPNQKGVEQALRLALALDCKINQQTKFDRKNYFYPDLPKGYQISQYDLPIGYEGFLEVTVEGEQKRFRITRVHLEEDTGKSVHDAIPGKTALDFNKSGMPLIEVVTEPDFKELKEVTAFAKLLKQTVEYTGVSDAEMQKGQMRFELNISLRPVGETELPNYKVEVKNIGSISVLEKVIEFEITRQSQLLDAGEKIPQQTRGLKDMTGVTVEQRVKESSDDYRYFPEPDIPPIEITDQWIKEIKHSMPELPSIRSKRYADLGLAKEQIEVLTDNRPKAAWLDTLFTSVSSSDWYTVLSVEEKQSYNLEFAKWFVGDIGGLLEKNDISVEASPVKYADLVYLVRQLKESKLNGTGVKNVIQKLFASGGEAAAIVEAEGLTQVQDNSQIEAWVDQAISENPDIVANIAKNPNAINALKGKVMAMSRGAASPQVVEELLKLKLT